MAFLSTRGAVLATVCGFLLHWLAPAAHAQPALAPWEWAARGYGPGSGATPNQACQVQADATGNTYLGGTYTTTLRLATTTLSSTGARTGFVASYAPTGSLRWAQQLSSADGPTTVEGLAIDGLGGVYAVGQFSGSLSVGPLQLTDPNVPPTGPSVRNGFVAKFNAQGVPQWLLRLGAPAGLAGAPATCTSVVCGLYGLLTVSGFYTGSVQVAGQTVALPIATNHALYVARILTPVGAAPTAAWLRSSSAMPLEPTPTLALGASATVYLGTAFDGRVEFGSWTLPGAGPMPALGLVKYTMDGAEEWVRQLPTAYPGSASATEARVALAALPSGGTYVLTSELDPAAPAAHRLQLMQFSELGTTGWSEQLPASNVHNTLHALTVDRYDNLYAVGEVQDSLRLGGLTVHADPASAGDACIFSFDYRHAPRWAQRFSSGSGSEALTAVAVTAPDVLHVAGTAQGAAQLGPFALPGTATAPELLVGRLHTAVLAATQAATASRLLLAPNPAHGSTTLTLTLPAAATPQPLTLLDALGRPVRRYTVPAGTATAVLDVAALPAGLYVLRGAGASRKLVLE